MAQRAGPELSSEGNAGELLKVAAKAESSGRSATDAEVRVLLRDLGRALSHMSEATDMTPQLQGDVKLARQLLLEHTPEELSGPTNANRIVNLRVVVLDAMAEVPPLASLKEDTVVDFPGLSISSPPLQLSSHRAIEETVRTRLAGAMRSTSEMTALV